MTLSLSLLDVLIFLLPGFVYFAISNSDGKSVVFKVLPTSGSLTVLSGVPMMAMVCHTIWAFLFYIQELAAKNGFVLLEVPFDPNVYKWMYLKSSPPDISNAAILYVFMMIFLISLTPIFFVSGWIGEVLKVIFKKTSHDVPRRNEDWLSFLIRKSAPDDRWLVAYIVTAQKTKEGSIGYVGVVEKVGRESDGNISFVVIDDVQSFILKDTGSGAERVQDEVLPLPIHSFQREDYVSLSFEVHTREPIPTDADSGNGVTA